MEAIANLPTERTENQLATIARDMDAAVEFMQAAKSPNTRRAYGAGWRCFAAYCQAAGLQPLPADPQTVTVYLAAVAKGDHPGAGSKPLGKSAIEQRLAAIRFYHEDAGHPTPMAHPAVKRVHEGIRRSLASRQPRRKTPIRTDDLRRIVPEMDGGLLAVRDKALLLAGFVTSCRRSELVALEMDDLHEHKHGIAVLIRHGKTDQTGEGRTAVIPFGKDKETCPVTALRAWIKAAGISSGAVFRAVDRHGNVGERMSEKGVARAVKRSVGRVGMNADLFGGHSLRAGHVSEAVANGASPLVVRRQTGHATERMLDVYTRLSRDEDFVNGSAAKLGL